MMIPGCTAGAGMDELRKKWDELGEPINENTKKIRR